MSAQHQHPYPQPVLAETRHFEIDPERMARTIKRAIEHAFGAPLRKRTPGLWLIARSQKKMEEQQIERVIQMHKIWRALALNLGAPKRATYRDAPSPVALPLELPLELAPELAHELPAEVHIRRRRVLPSSAS